MTLLAPYRHPSCPFRLPSPFLLPCHLSRFTELSIHYSICYLICVCRLVCSLPYPFLLVRCRGPQWKQDSFWILLPPYRRVLDVIVRYLGLKMGDVSMIDMILPP